MKEYEQQYQDGLITQREKYNKVVDAWSRCTDQVADEMMKSMEAVEKGKPTNSVYVMAHSGARGSAAQIKQLAGMRGLMAKPSGEIIETPIISNFKEGLSVLEYFNSTHGARKGLADTALKTANSGYLTRRLVDVAQDCIVYEQDCGTNRGISIRAVDRRRRGSSFRWRSASWAGRPRVISYDPADDVHRQDGDLIEEEGAEAIDRLPASIVVKARSALTCEAGDGICGKCYGRDLARGTPVNVGEAVGVIAAQSIGEPGTQLTMRTFHIGGAAQRGAEQSSVEASIDSVVSITNRNVVEAADKPAVVMARNSEDRPQRRNRPRARGFRVPYGARLLVDEGAKVERGDTLAEWDPYTMPIITEKAGTANYMDLAEGVSMREDVDEATGIASKVVVDWRQQPKGAEFRPRITLRDKKGEVVILPNGQEARYFMSVGAPCLSVENGQEVHCRRGAGAHPAGIGQDP